MTNQYRIDQDRDRCGEELHQPAGDAEGRDLGHGHAGGNLPVRLEEPLRRDHGGQVGLVADIEEDRQPGGQQRDDVERLDPQVTGESQEGDGPEHDRAAKVRHDQHRPPAQAVDDRAGEQPDEKPGDIVRGAEECDLAG